MSLLKIKINSYFCIHWIQTEAFCFISLCPAAMRGKPVILAKISTQLHLKVSQYTFQKFFLKLLSKTAQHMICGQLIYFKLFSLLWISDQLIQHGSKHFLCSSFLYSYFSFSFILLDVCLYQCPVLMSPTQSGAFLNCVCTAGVCL